MQSDWRTAVFNRVAITTSLALFVVTAFVLTRAFLEGRNIFTFGTTTVIAASLLTIPLAIVKTHVQIRAAFEVVILLSIGLFVAYMVGLSPGPSIALVIAAVLASLFLGATAGLVTLITTILGLIAVGWLQANIMRPQDAEPLVIISLQSWAITTGIFGTLTGVLIILIIHVVNTIERRTNDLAQTLEQLEDTQRALTESKRIEGLGRLAAGIAHDFNNTLHVVMSWASIIEESADPKTRVHGVEAIQKASEKASALTAKLLTLGRSRLQNPTTTYPRQILEDLTSSTANILPKDILLQLELSDTPPVFVDPAELEQLMLNLVLNARDAMPNGGNLTIGLSDFNKQFSKDNSKQSMVHIWVTDTGIGMDQETLRSIFDPFYTTKGSLGTGLGLSSAHTFAETASGSLTAESAPGQGTTIHLYLPTATDSENTDTAQMNPSIKGRRVLYAEDDSLVRPAMEQAFRDTGVVIVMVIDLVSAINVLEQKAETFDLLYIDASEHNSSTNQLIESFRIHSPDGKILLTSTHVPDPNMRSAITLGKIEFLQKPYQPEALIKKTTSLLQGLTG